MNEAVPTKIKELIKLLSNEEIEDEHVAELVPYFTEGLKNPKVYIETNPEEVWLAQGHDVNDLPPHIGQDVFTWMLGCELEDFLIVGDKGDDMAEFVIDDLSDYGVEIDFPQLKNWFEYDDYIEQALIKAKSNLKLITLDLNFSDNASIFIVPRDKYKELVELLRFFGVKQIKR